MSDAHIKILRFLDQAQHAALKDLSRAQASIIADEVEQVAFNITMMVGEEERQPLIDAFAWGLDEVTP